MYILKAFGTTDLPTADNAFNNGVGIADTAVKTIGGGVYSRAGSTVKQPSLPFQIKFRGLLHDSTEDAVRNQSNLLRSLVGSTDILYRQPRISSLDTIRHQLQAELLSFEPVNQNSKNWGCHEIVDMQFQCLSRWEGEEHTMVGYLTDTSGLPATENVLLSNFGNRNQDVVSITVWVGGGVMTMFGLDFLSCSWRWNALTGGIPGGYSLTIDCDKKSISTNYPNYNPYPEFALTGNHTIEPWLIVPKNTALPAVAHYATNADGSWVEIKYRDGWM